MILRWTCQSRPNQWRHVHSHILDCQKVRALTSIELHEVRQLTVLLPDSLCSEVCLHPREVRRVWITIAEGEYTMHWNKYQKLSKVPNQWIAFFARSDWLLKLGIFNTYSPKWRWIAPAGIYREPRRGEINIYHCSPYGRSIAQKRQMFTCSKRRLNFTKLQIYCIPGIILDRKS